MTNLPNRFFSKEVQPISLPRAHLADSIQNQPGLSKKQFIRVIESMLEVIKETLKNGEGVLITGFGKFCVNVKKKRSRRKCIIFETGRSYK
jgi:integration host factor subunit alpha